MMPRTVAVRVSVCVAAAVVTLWSCDSPTAPAQARVDLTASIDNQEMSIADDHASVSCVVKMVARITGTARAHWQDGTIAFFIGPTGSHPVDTARFTVNDLAVMFGSADFHGDGDGALTGRFQIGGPVTFGMRIQLRYRVESSSTAESVSADVDCGPRGGAEPPDISTLKATPANGVVNLGDSIAISYMVQNKVGVARTSVTVPRTACSGAYSWHVDEGMAVSVNRTVYVPIARDCALGGHITSAQIVAYDIGLMRSASTLTFDAVIADTSKPKLSINFGTGRFFVGDTLRLGQTWATDNGTITNSLWEIVGTTQSHSGAGVVDLTVPITDQTIPGFQLRVLAQDAAGNSAEAISAPGAMRVYPNQDVTARTASLYGMYYDMVVDDNGLVYLATGDAQVAIFSVASMTVVGSVGMPTRVYSVDVTPSGDSLFVPVGKNLGIVDLRSDTRIWSLRPITAIEPLQTQKAVSVRLTSNGHALLNVADTVSGVASPIDMDLATWQSRRIQLPSELYGYRFVARSGDRARFLMSGIAFQNAIEGDGYATYDAATGATGPVMQRRIPSSRTISVNETGSRFAVGLDAYDAALTHISTAPRVFDDATIIAPDGATLWQTDTLGHFVRTNAADGTIIDRITDGVDRRRQLTAEMRRLFTRDGKSLIVLTTSTSGDQSTISVTPVP